VNRLQLAIVAPVALLLACDRRPSASPAADAGGGTVADERPRPQRPYVDIPAGPPPTTMQSTDVSVGRGTEAHVGSRVELHYTGLAWSNHREFDSSWTNNQTYTFTLGNHEVIRGWEQGIVGMRVGGRRRLVIPPSLGYGAHGSPPAVGPNETLVFVVDLMRVVY